MGVPCSIEGVENAICVSSLSIVNQTSFCNKYNYPYVCVPVFHVYNTSPITPLHFLVLMAKLDDRGKGLPNQTASDIECRAKTYGRVGSSLE